MSATELMLKMIEGQQTRFAWECIEHVYLYFEIHYPKEERLRQVIDRARGRSARPNRPGLYAELHEIVAEIRGTIREDMRASGEDENPALYVVNAVFSALSTDCPAATLYCLDAYRAGTAPRFTEREAEWQVRRALELLGRD